MASHQAIMEAGGFTVVSTRRGGRKEPARRPPASNQTAFPYRRSAAADSKERVLAVLEERVSAAATELRASALWMHVRKLVRALSPVKSVVCLGVGNFADHPGARYQLALALLLREQEHDDHHHKLPLSVFDPVLTKDEIAFVRSLGGTVPTTNEEGRVLAEEQTTLFFMPHCAKQCATAIATYSLAALLPRQRTLNEPTHVLCP